MKRKRATADGLSRELVVERALALADAEGLDAVTIRRLGQELGVTPMALYWHVQSKDELLDAMGDQLWAALRYDASPTQPWHAALAGLVQGLLAALRAHPTCTSLASRRVFACSDGLQAAEYIYGVLLDAGFTRRQTADIAIHALQTAAMLVRSEPGAEPGLTPEAFEAKKAAKARALESLPREQYPHIRELADEILDCEDTGSYYEFGVDVFVAGARAMLVEEHRAQRAGRTAVTA